MIAHIVYEIPLWGHLVSIFGGMAVGVLMFWLGVRMGTDSKGE